MKNMIYSEADCVPLVVPYASGVKAGDGILVGGLYGIATSDGAQNETVWSKLRGAAIQPKASGAISAGQRVFWDDTARVITTTATGNFHVGFALAAAGASDTTVNIVLLRGPAAGA